MVFIAIILWGPPGTGKAELREVIANAQERRKLYGNRRQLFCDGII